MKRFMLTLAILLSLATLSMAEIVITTADGNGADTMISNDGNKSYTYVGGGGTHLEVRHYDGVRAKAAMFRFDISGGFAGDLSGAYFQVYQHSSTRSRQLSLYVLADGEWDNWTEGSVNYSTFPGISEPYDNSGYLNFDSTMWTRVAYLDSVQSFAGTVQSYDSTGDPNALAAIDLSFIEEDTNGLVTFMLWKDATDSAYDAYHASKESDVNSPAALVFPNAVFATDPIPANGADVGTVPETLSWTNVTPQAEGGIITCDVYFGTTADRSAMAMVTTGADESSVPTSTFGAITPGTYYWAVDTYDTSADPNGLNEPTSLGEGFMWSFTYSLAPAVVTSPETVIVDLGAPASFSATFDSSGVTAYSWYYSADASNATFDDDVMVGGNSTTLDIAATVAADEGYYYCKAVNSSGEAKAAYTDVAGLGVQRQSAYWTLDEVAGGVFADTSGNGVDLTPAGVPVLVEGAAGMAIDVDPNGVSLGDFNPAYVTGAFTVTAWIKSDGANGTYQNIAAKTDTWASDDMQFQFGLSSTGNFNLLSAAGTSCYGGNPAVGEWVFVAASFNGSTVTVYRSDSSDVDIVRNSGNFRLGSDDAAQFAVCALASGAESLNGAVDEIEFYNYALTDLEVIDVYSKTGEQSFCMLEYASSTDLNGDCEINLGDFAILALNWLECGLYPACP